MRFGHEATILESRLLFRGLLTRESRLALGLADLALGGAVRDAELASESLRPLAGLLDGSLGDGADGARPLGLLGRRGCESLHGVLALARVLDVADALELVGIDAGQHAVAALGRLTTGLLRRRGEPTGGESCAHSAELGIDVPLRKSTDDVGKTATVVGLGARLAVEVVVDLAALGRGDRLSFRGVLLDGHTLVGERHHIAAVTQRHRRGEDGVGGVHALG